MSSTGPSAVDTANTSAAPELATTPYGTRRSVISVPAFSARTATTEAALAAALQSSAPQRTEMVIAMDGRMALVSLPGRVLVPVQVQKDE
jgi:hypothetical protein